MSMVPDSEANIGSEHAQPASGALAPRRVSRGRGRRGGRGRGRGGRPPPRARPLDTSPGGPGVETVPQTTEAVEAQPNVLIAAERPSQPSRSEPALRTAIDEVNKVIETLRESLEDMEEVLETLELVERQQNADDQEVETLRRQLRMLRRPRDVGP